MAPVAQAQAAKLLPESWSIWQTEMGHPEARSPDLTSLL
jgi:hypothetical protein